MMEDPSKAIDNLFSSDLEFFDQVNILIIGLKETYDQINSLLTNEFGYTIYHNNTVDEAISNLIRLNFTIIMLDHSDINLNTIAVSNLVRQHHKLAKIVLLSQQIDVKKFSSIFNNGSLDAMLTLPTDYVSLIKLLTEQEAKYSINKAVTSFVSKPPELSKASILLLDPSLSFGDEIPLNFVGVMISSRTVPRFSRFFEKTLAHDEVLMTSYLSAITVLGGELFKNQEALKEINFGGISVIIRFFEHLQISFLVRNLTSKNFKKAEDRISAVVSEITNRFGAQLQSSFLKNQEEEELASLMDEFDRADSEDLGNYRELQLKQNLKNYEKQRILIYGSDLEHQEELRTRLLDAMEDNDLDIAYTVQITDNEETAIKIVKIENCGVLILDSILKNDKIALEFAEFIKDLSPPIQIIYLERELLVGDNLISAVNTNFLDFIFEYPTDLLNIQDLIWIAKLGLQNSLNIQQKSIIGNILDTDSNSLSVARTLLRENIDSFSGEVVPELHGILITNKMETIFEQFWEFDDAKIEFDREILAGIIASLTDAGDEMFTDKQLLGSIELEGKNVFIRNHGQFLFVFFVKNITRNTAVLINKEVEAVASVYYDIIIEAGSSIPYTYLKTIFLQIANKTKNDFTKLLRISEN